MGLAIYSRSKPLRIALAATAAINFFFIAITGTLLGWMILVTGVISIIFFANKGKLFSEKVVFLGLLVIVLPILALTLIPKTRGFLIDGGYVTEYILPARESWVIVTSTIQEYPILATGPSTFDLNFTRFKPLSLNATDFWNIKFDKPYNELFNILGTIGIVGMAAAAFFAVKTVKFTLVTAKEVKDEDGFSVVAGAMALLILVSFLFAYASILTTFLLFLALGLMVGINSFNGNSRYTKSLVIEYASMTSILVDDKTAIGGQFTKYIMSIPAFVLAGFLGYLSFKNYAGEYYMRKSLVAISNNNSGDAYRYQILAIQYNPNRDMYYDSFARTNLAIANALASKPNLTDADKQTIQTLVTQAIRNTRLATEVVSPLNVDNWETRAIIYKSIVNLAQNASEWAISSYNTAIQLDPTNARFRIDLGGIYFAKGDFLSANQFRQATALKSDYANAHFNFALALAELKQYDLAKQELDITKLLLPAGSQDAKTVDAIISQLPQPTPAAAATAAKPTVEELSGVKPTTPQEPLVNTATTGTQNLTPKVIPQQ
jgi:tetratricopeptide (TPR) repeat protein